MRITKEQAAALRNIRCVRVKDVDKALLRTIVGPIIDNEGHRSRLIDLFRNKKHLADEENNDIASFLLLAPL